MRTYPDVGIAVSEVLLPAQQIDPRRWAVVACDQYTSEPEYWQSVEALVADAPSTLRLIFPEVYLEGEDKDARIDAIRAAMDSVLDGSVLRSFDGLVYVERRVHGQVRRGLVCCVDLEAYDYSAGSTSLIRATEGTIVDRLPPRIRIREGAALELPHIMVLIDDPEDTVLGPLAAARDRHEVLYAFDLMNGGGHLRGFGVRAQELEAGVVAALSRLADPDRFAATHGLPSGTPVLLFAMGDGNHSLATAKAIWEKVKAAGQAQPDDPRRYALVELVNVHDQALDFEPIHRVFFSVAEVDGLEKALEAHFGARLTRHSVQGADDLVRAVEASTETVQRFGVIGSKRLEVFEVTEPDANLPVGTLQPVLDAFLAQRGAHHVDYVHGTETVLTLGGRHGNRGIYLPGMSKSSLFKTVIVDGALPRKTFSMGEAHEKRFYMECRRLR